MFGLGPYTGCTLDGMTLQLLGFDLLELDGKYPTD
jgi:hypothetical protein